MKYFSKLMAAVLTLSMLLSGITAMAEEGKVEISFCVGDETLMINGEAVTVEKPYVVGEGVTLVPLRVITEAFGATVEWEQETKTVYLTYPDVNIVLQIANPVAEVNGRAEQLLAAPELTNSVTMVPLRFISETFGAEVGYEPDTRQITVVKTVSTDSLSMVIGAVDNQYVGDSYYGWSIENPKDMQIAYRSFDGTSTQFVYDNNNFVFMMIAPVDDEVDLEKEFIEGKNAIAADQYTLVRADKDTSNPNLQTIHFQAKDKSTFLDMSFFVTKKYKYVLYGYFEVDKTAIKDECVRIMSTFTCSYNSASDIYDLSNVESDFRRFTADTVKLSFDVPADFYMTSSDTAENEFNFSSMDPDDSLSSLAAAVYSKSDVESAQSLANTDYTNNRRGINEELATFSSGVTQKEYSTFTAYEYEYTIKSSMGEEYSRDVFFEIGEYVYNIRVTVRLPHPNKNGYVDAIINGVEAKELDASEVGILMRNVSEATGTFTVEVGNGEITVPNDYSETTSADGTVTLMGPGMYILCSSAPAPDLTTAQLTNNMKNNENSDKQLPDTEIISTTKATKLGQHSYMGYTAYTKDETGGMYVQTYAMVRNGMIYAFSVIYPEIGYSAYHRSEVDKILASLDID